MTRNQLNSNTMKKNFLFIVAALMAMPLASCTINFDGESFGGKTIKGNGNIVTRNYDVTMFDEISIALPATVNFTVSDNYTCTVQVDENIMECLNIRVEDQDLLLGRRKEDKNVNLQATRFIIDITAPSLKDISLAGSGTLNVLSPMEGMDLEVDLAGSGDIIFHQTLTVHEIDLSVAGSGDLSCNELFADKLDADIAGSGDLKVLSGNVREVETSVAGSGDIVLTCDIVDLDADIAGSGDIKARVSGKLEYSIIGSGDIGYYGNPVLNGSKAGSGRVTRLGD